MRFPAVCFLVFCLVAGQAIAQPRSVSIGVVIDGPGALNEPVQALTQQAILELTTGEFDVTFDPAHRIVADWTLEGVTRSLDDLFDREDVDIVLAMGVLASHQAATRESFPKPVVAPFILNFGLDRVPLADGASGVRNLSYLVLPRTVQRDLVMFRSIVEVEKLAVLFSADVVRGLPYIRDNIETTLRDEGLPFQSILVEDDVAGAVGAIDADVDGVLVMPMVHLSRDSIEAMARGLIDRKMPSFSLLGRRDVEAGILAALNPDIFPRITRRIGLTVQSILLGDAPESLPVAFAAGEKLSINLGTANAMNLPLRWATVTEADVFEDTSKDEGRELTLIQAVAEALQVNRQLVAAQQSVTASAEETARARSRRYPQVDVGAQALLIDEDRAETGFGQAPEQSLRGSLTVSQLIYSHEANANVAIQDRLQESREEELRGVRLNVAQEAAAAYLQVLRAKSFERIQKENLQLTRSNLELAQVREMVGQSGPAEALRFESQLASNIRDAIAANSQRNVAEIQVNRLLNRPLEEAFHTAEAGLHDVLAQLEADEVTYYFESKVAFAMFRDFMAREGLERSPEVAALDRAIEAQRRLATAAGRSLWQPDLLLQGETSHLFSESGAGTEPPALFGDGAVRDDTDWSLALALSFPLFEGGAKWSQRRQATAGVLQLEHEREALAQRIEQRVRSALHIVGSSYAGIDQAQRARDAARQSLDIVVDAYGQGTVSILDLLDAQNRALVADEQEAAAVFDFFIDLMEVYRSIGAVELMLDPGRRAELLSRADAFFEAEGFQPRPRVQSSQEGES